MLPAKTPVGKEMHDTSKNVVIKSLHGLEPTSASRKNQQEKKPERERFLKK